MYILVVEWSGSETSVYTYATLEELKADITTGKGSCRVKGNDYLIAKVLATSNSVINDVKDE